MSPPPAPDQGPRLRIVIVEANTPDSNALIRSMGGRVYSDIYRSLLKAIAPEARIEIVAPCEMSANDIVEQISNSQIDGVAWTGSSLNAYKAGPELQNQIALFEHFWDARIPIFGSCWGLQLMATALGGRVRKNPWGREIGIARGIQATPQGAAHPMYAGKPGLFDSICTHTDDVEVLPTGCVVLAHNAACAVQAAAIEDGGRSFWGVQYHPEFSFKDLSVVLARLSQQLISEGLFAGGAEIEAARAGFAKLDAAPSSTSALRRVLGVSESVADKKVRELEITNWVETRVSEHFQARAR